MPKKENTAGAPSKWDGIARSKYQPPRFYHRGDSYVYKDLTREQIEQLADDDRCSLFSRK